LLVKDPVVIEWRRIFNQQLTTEKPDSAALFVFADIHSVIAPPTADA
jgi:hypothetical protein